MSGSLEIIRQLPWLKLETERARRIPIEKMVVTWIAKTEAPLFKAL